MLHVGIDYHNRKRTRHKQKGRRPALVVSNTCSRFVGCFSQIIAATELGLGVTYDLLSLELA
jgi:hypothetical protein